MSLISKYESWLEQQGVSHETVLWTNSIIVSVYVYIVVALYIGGIEGLGELRLVNKATGYVGYILILLSMAMSSFCYFWNFADKYMLYRKYLGVVGALYACFHFVFSLYLIMRFTTLTEFILNPDNTAPFFLGLAATVVLVFLIVISFKWAVTVLGGTLWRNLLRLGYLAVIFSILHLCWRSVGDWVAWLQQENGILLPPMSLLMALVTGVILFLRLLMQWSIMKKVHMKQPEVPVVETSTKPSL